MARAKLKARNNYNRRKTQFQCNKKQNPNRNLRLSGVTGRKTLKIELEIAILESKNLSFNLKMLQLKRRMTVRGKLIYPGKRDRLEY